MSTINHRHAIHQHSTPTGIGSERDQLLRIFRIWCQVYYSTLPSVTTARACVVQTFRLPFLYLIPCQSR